MSSFLLMIAQELVWKMTTVTLDGLTFERLFPLRALSLDLS